MFCLGFTDLSEHQGFQILGDLASFGLKAICCFVSYYISKLEQFSKSCQTHISSEWRLLEEWIHKQSLRKDNPNIFKTPNHIFLNF